MTLWQRINTESYRDTNGKLAFDGHTADEWRMIANTARAARGRATGDDASDAACMIADRLQKLQARTV